MSWLRGIPAAALCALAVAAGLTALEWRVERDELRALTASQSASIRALEMERDNARMAREVAQAARERFEAKARQYDDLREALLKGDDDAPLPAWFRSYLADLGVLRAGDAD